MLRRMYEKYGFGNGVNRGKNAELYVGLLEKIPARLYILLRFYNLNFITGNSASLQGVNEAITMV